MRVLPSIRHLGPADYATMPWKNGLGVTTELAIAPAGASLAGPFDWRLSVAELGASGPFSRIPGVERIIIQLEGAPMRLTHAGHPGRSLALLAPYRFQGEWETHGELAVAPARDFNVMAARDRVSAQVSVHQLLRGSAVHALGQAAEQALYCFAGRASVTVKGADAPRRLEAGETLLITAPADGGIEAAMAAETDAVLLLVSFSRKA